MLSIEICSKRDSIIPLRIIDEENVRAYNKNLLFVGVMTAAKYLDTRAKAVYNTWGRQVPGKIMFYSSEFSYSEHVPLVALKEVDDRYPPQKKSFKMLKHIHDNFIDQYEWFLRADDDVYIRTDRLEHLLRSVDSRKPWFIGKYENILTSFTCQRMIQKPCSGSTKKFADKKYRYMNFFKNYLKRIVMISAFYYNDNLDIFLDK